MGPGTRVHHPHDEVGESVADEDGMTTTVPPMVGVPRLVWCDVGPSSRMNCP